ncbi:ATP-dependent DNA helicase RecQ [Nitriliruptoraceae bacterium ZYF776]|nr:ATP-dependent DNA helicase RecQ [Profundirhabdus halotolerans]
MRTAARDLLDVRALRAGQKEAVQAVLEGRDTLAVLPTGWGKSAIYQLAGELLDGPTVVVSPLIALQADQLRAIAEHDELSAAAALNSTLRAAERRAVEDQLADGSLEYLLLAPEQLTRSDTIEQLRDAGVSLFVVDEAHCVSDWGHDFRPDYLRLAAAIEAVGRPTVLALTATAAPPVRTEIVERLGLRDPALVVHGFDRPNIHLAVRHVEDEDRHREAVVAACVRDAATGPGILYVATRRQAETFASELRIQGLHADHYHGGMTRDERTRVHDAFQGDELDVVVATPAFGMGIDKPNVRFVHHAHVPDSLDSYHQEVGRAGRDGDPAVAILFHRVADLGLRRFFNAGGGHDPTTIETLATAIDGAEGDVDVAWLEDRAELSATQLTRALTSLEATGFARLRPDGTVEQLGDGPDPDEVAEVVVTRAEARDRYEASRLEMMQAYAETDRCRGRFLLDYYGQHTDELCGHCDRCDAGIEVAAPVELPFALQSRVEHPSLGLGTVTRYEEDRVVVVFDDAGYRTLSLEVVADQDLLRAAP